MRGTLYPIEHSRSLSNLYLVLLKVKLGILSICLCFLGDSIGKLQSHYDTRLADRTWKFDCRPSNLNIKKCSMAWTGQESIYDLRYTCKGGIIAGNWNILFTYINLFYITLPSLLITVQIILTLHVTSTNTFDVISQ